MTDQLLALADHHEQAFSAFLRMDALEHPEPAAPHWWQGLPWLMLPFSLVALAGIALSALRTGPVFQAAAEPVVGKDFAILEAILAVVITELFLVVSRYVIILMKARDGHTVHSIDKLMLSGFWLAFGVALFANLYANVGDLPLLAPVKGGVDLLVGILVAISAPVLAFICGDILAVLWLQSERHRSEMRQQFQLLMEEYKAARERRWNAQKARYGVRIEVAREPVHSLRSVNEPTNEQHPPVHSVNRSVNAANGYSKNMNAKNAVAAWLLSNRDARPELMTMKVDELHALALREVGGQIGRTSVHNARKEIENGNGGQG